MKPWKYIYMESGYLNDSIYLTVKSLMRCPECNSPYKYGGLKKSLICPGCGAQLQATSFLPSIVVCIVLYWALSLSAKFLLVDLGYNKISFICDIGLFLFVSFIVLPRVSRYAVRE